MPNAPGKRGARFTRSISIPVVRHTYNLRRHNTLQGVEIPESVQAFRPALSSTQELDELIDDVFEEIRSTTPLIPAIEPPSINRREQIRQREIIVRGEVWPRSIPLPPIPPPRRPHTPPPRMADTTIQNAQAEARNPAKPKFVATDVFDPSTTSPLAFVRNYERAALANGWNDAAKINYFGSYVDGVARQWFAAYLRNADNAAKTWRDLVTDFTAEYAGVEPERRLRDKLHRRVQATGESLKSYYYAVKKLAFEIDDEFPFAKFLEHFERGLSAKSTQSYFMLRPDNMGYTELQQLILKLADLEERLVDKNLADRVNLLTVSDQQPSTRPPPPPQQHSVQPYNQYGYQSPQQYAYEYPPRQPRYYDGVYQPPPGAQNGYYRRQSRPNERSYGRYYHPKPPAARTHDNRPICNVCQRVGHYGAYCRTPPPPPPRDQEHNARYASTRPSYTTARSPARSYSGSRYNDTNQRLSRSPAPMERDCRPGEAGPSTQTAAFNQPENRRVHFSPARDTSASRRTPEN